MSAAVLLSRVTGLLREILMARLFGAGLILDAFVLGFRVPNLARDLFAEGALSSAFVPTFTEYINKKTRREAAELSNLVATALILLIGAISIAGVIFSPQLVRLMASGFEEVPGKFELAVRMTRIMFPFLLLVALAAQAMGMLNACNQFGVPALASSFFNIGSVVFGLALGFWLGPWLGIPSIEGMAYGVVLGGGLQLFWQLPSLGRAGFQFRPRFNWSHSGLLRIIRLMGPAILGSAAVQINVVVNTNFASRIEDPLRGFDGPVSWLGFAFRFMQLPLGLFGVAIAAATLPAISRSAASGDMEQFRRTLSRSLSMVFLLTLPSAVGLAILGDSMVAAIYQGGKFESYDTQQTAAALSCYAIGLAGYAALKVLTPAFYALNDSRTPMLVGIASIVINYVVVSALIRQGGWGHASLALATSAVALFGFAAQFWLLNNRLGGLYNRGFLASTVKILAASMAMGLVVNSSSPLVRSMLGDSRLSCLADLAVSVPCGILVFYSGCRLLRVPELELVFNAFASPALGWILRQRAKIL